MTTSTKETTMSESILEEAQRLIHGERNKNYGHPRENFADIAALYSGYLGQPISDIDVANLMILMKIARVKGTGYHRDSFTDIAGYAGCVERIYEEPVPETMLVAGYVAPEQGTT
ncbi:hypothetical protein SEA_KRISTOFF_54 [Mycobacterium phage Kristoff]|uniref:DUF6378 domain-containing protein n=4 Tax=Fromanvirus TaxID=186764 RepID=A0A482JEB0_9CAUD|nr:hypothetical protein SEA_KRISTOFF_54 [Mycobacterium phage Kristoff]